MKNTFKIFLGCAVLVSALTAGTVRSQGTAGASQLLIPVGAETVALSGTNVGTVAGVDALFTNVAGLARHNSGLQGTVSTTSYVADIDVVYAGMVVAMGETGTFGDLGPSERECSLTTPPRSLLRSVSFEISAGRYR